jgi:hypothetical protein
MHRYSTSDPNFQPVPRLSDVHIGLVSPGRPVSPAGRYIQQRYRVCAELADLIAVMAGLTGDQS